jgi:hypothetical protein
VSPADFFLALNEEEIARQLTLIEFGIYSAIEPSELLNQSWNKDKLKYRASNAIESLARLNRLSFWVPMMILTQERMKDRARMYLKVVRVADVTVPPSVTSLRFCSLTACPLAASPQDEQLSHADGNGGWPEHVAYHAPEAHAQPRGRPATGCKAPALSFSDSSLFPAEFQGVRQADASARLLQELSCRACKVRRPSHPVPVRA